MKVSELMMRFPLSIQSTDDLGLARSMMAWATVRHLPVIDEGKLVGILSARDVVANTDVGTVADIMSTPPQSIHPEDPVIEAAGRMATSRLGALPVLDHGELVGIISTVDILASQVDVAMQPSDQGPMVSHYMTEDPVTMHPDDYALMALDRMREYQVRHLPIVDGDRKVVGMISDRDLRVAIGEPWRSDRPAHATVALQSMRVQQLMWMPSVTLSPTNRCVDVARHFASERLSTVPVTDEGGKLLGVLSYVDLLRALSATDT